ncbi:MAG: glycosyltransferase, partial [Candidatus Weimeria sp.]
MMTVSLCMIVKNEEKVLKRCLDSVADLCNEVVIVDTGSTDSTKSIAAKYTSHVYDFEWCDDFCGTTSDAAEAT